jgi:peptide/nickel transport system substrate-binding protein
MSAAFARPGAHERRRARLVYALLAVALGATACLHRPIDDPSVIVVAMTTAPNNLDPRIGTDESSGRTAQLMFSSLMKLDDRLQVVGDLAETLENPEPTVYVVSIRHGVKFHDGRELTAKDVVYTFRCFLDPSFISGWKGAYKSVKSVEARDPYTVVFTLSEPFGSFPINLVMPIVPDGSGPDFREHPIGSGPYKFVRYLVDDRIELAPFDEYFGGTPKNGGLVIRIVPDDIMRGLELRKGTVDLVVNDITPDIVYQLEKDPNLQAIVSPGTDYQYIGLNLRDPILKDLRVRQALAYAVDRDAIVKYLRRGLATPATGMLPPMAWAYDPAIATFDHDPAKAKALLDDAGYRDPDDDGPLPRFTLTYKTSTGAEFNRLQATVIQQSLRDVGVDLDVRTYEFATMYADVLKGNFQMYGLQWVGGALADPDILRRVFHSSQIPPAGFNRGFFSDPRVDRLLDEAAVSTDQARRKALYGEVQEAVADAVPYVSLWCKKNVVVARRSIEGIHLLPNTTFTFLKDVSRSAPLH